MLTKLLGRSFAPDTKPEVLVRAAAPLLPLRKLKPVEISKLVAAYQAGKSIDTLALDFVIHRQTVMLHLKRQNIARRPQQKLDEQAMQRATEL
jgi:hypothetical protein